MDKLVSFLKALCLFLSQSGHLILYHSKRPFEWHYHLTSFCDYEPRGLFCSYQVAESGHVGARTTPRHLRFRAPPTENLYLMLQVRQLFETIPPCYLVNY